jgi:hypothetical protein
MSQTSIELVRGGISMVLASAFVGVTIYEDPVQEKATLPAFYIMDVNPTLDRGIGWYKRSIFWDVSYVDVLNIIDKQTRLTAVQETLDLTLSTINFSDNVGNAVSIITYDRKSKKDLANSVLHYTFYTKEWVYAPSGTTSLMPTNLTVNMEAKNGN